MSEAPVKIWMTENPEAWTTRDDMFNTPYIRADLFHELTEALELLVSYGDVFAYRAGTENPYRKGKAALAKARGERR